MSFDFSSLVPGQNREDAVPPSFDFGALVTNPTVEPVTDSALGGEGKVLQETDDAVGPPPQNSLTEVKALNSIQMVEDELPNTGLEAIHSWRKRGFDYAVSSGRARQIEKRAQARTMAFLMDNGLFSEGRFVQGISDGYVEKVRKAFMFTEAGWSADLTSDDNDAALTDSLLRYAEGVKARASARRQELVANLAPNGEISREVSQLLAKQDLIFNSAQQLQSRAGDSAVLGAWKGWVATSNARLRTELSPTDRNTAAEFGLTARSLNQTTSGITDFSSVLSLDPEDQQSGPGRLLANTGLALEDSEDPNSRLRFIHMHFDRSVNRSRAARLGGSPDSDVTGQMLLAFPTVATDLAELQIRRQVLERVGVAGVEHPAAFEAQVEAEKAKRLESATEQIVARSRDLGREIDLFEAEESRGVVLDAVAVAQRSIGTVAGALSEIGEGTRELFLESGSVAAMRRAQATTMGSEAGFEAMKAADESVRFTRQPSFLGAFEKQAPRISPLADDFSNLDQVLAEAERAGAIPYSTRKALFSDNPNDLVANAAMVASEVLAPATIRRMLDLGLSLDEVKGLFRSARREAVEKKVLPGRTVEELADQEQLLNERLSVGGPVRALVSDTSTLLAAAEARWERGWKETALGFLDDPRTVFDTLVGFTPTAVGGGVVADGLLSAFRRRLYTSSLGDRVAGAVARTARADPEAATALRRAVGERLRMIGDSTEGAAGQRRVQETYRTAAALADTIAAEHRKGTLGALSRGEAPDQKTLDQATRGLRRTLRQLGPNYLSRTLERMGVDANTVDAIRQPATTIDLLRGGPARLAAALELDDVSAPTWTARKGHTAAQEIVDAIDAGAAPDWDSMAVPIDAVGSGEMNVYRQMEGAFEDAFPGSGRVIRASGAYAAKILDAKVRYADDVLATRRLQAEMRGNQVDFLTFLEKKLDGELADLEVASPEAVRQRAAALGLDTADADIVDNVKGGLRETRTRLVNARDTIDGREWDQTIRLERLRDVQKVASTYDLVSWARLQGSGSPVDFWQDMRLVGESLEQTESRLARASLGQIDDRAIRSRIMRRYLSAPGLSSKQRIDTNTGAVVNLEKARRLRAERGAVAQARAQFDALSDELNSAAPDRAGAIKRRIESLRPMLRYNDPEFPDEVLGLNLGLETKDLAGDFKLLRDLAQSDTQRRFLNFVERTQEFSDGRKGTQMADLRNAQLASEFQQSAAAQLTATFTRRYNKLTPEQRDLFNRAQAKSRDIGDYREVRKLAESDPDIKRLMNNWDDDKDFKVRSLLDDTDNFRRDLVDQAYRVGLISKGRRDDALGAYSAQLYSAFEHETLIGTNIRKGLTSETIDGADLTEFMRQKHPTQWRASVEVRGGRQVTELFPDRDAAVAWAQREYGLGETRKQARDGIEAGKSNLGDDVVITAPLDPERMRDLGFLGEGPSTFLRLETLVKDIHRHALTGLLDRPGWAYTAEQFANVAAGPRRAVFNQNFSQLDDLPRYGALRGKYVHKNVAKAFDEVVRGQELGANIAAAIKAWANDQGVLTRSMVGLPGTIKQALVTNKIARSLQTGGFNFLMDSEMFGPNAAGLDFSMVHPRGRASKLRAFRDLFGEGDDPRYIEALKIGVIDDGLIAHRISPQLRRASNDAIFGSVSRAKHLSTESKAFIHGFANGADNWMEAMEEFVGASGNPQLKALYDRWEFLDGRLRDRATHLRDTTVLTAERDNIEAKLQTLAPTRTNSARRAWQAAHHIFVGDQRQGLNDEFESLARENYGRISNVNRLGAFYHLRDKGYSPDQALARVNMFMQNYQGVPRWMRRLGQSAFGSPIVAFPYEQMRIMVNTLRHNPAMLTGFMGGVAGANFMSMVAGGLDPYRTQDLLATDSAGFPGFLPMATSIVVPEGAGGLSTFQVPALNWYQVFREPFGTQSKMFGLDDSPGLSAGEVVTNLASKFTLGQPLLHTGFAAIQGRDPESGKILRDRSDFAGRAARQLGELFIPPEIPFVGSISRQIAEGMERPPYVRSGREIQTSQRAIQSILGVRLRGKLGTGPLARRLGDGLATLIGAEAWTDLPVNSREGEAFGDKDLLAFAYTATRDLDPDSAATDRIEDQAFDKLRTAQKLLVSDNAQEQEVGRRMRDEAFAKFEENMGALAQFHGLEFERARTEQERGQLLARTLRTQRFEDQFDRVSVVRKTGILLVGAIGGLNAEQWDSLFNRTLVSERSGQLRWSSSTRAVGDAVKLLDEHLESPVTRRHADQLRQLRDFLEVNLQRATLDDQIEAKKDVLRAEAVDVFFGGNND